MTRYATFALLSVLCASTISTTKGKAASSAAFLFPVDDAVATAAASISTSSGIGIGTSSSAAATSSSLSMVGSNNFVYDSADPYGTATQRSSTYRPLFNDPNAVPQGVLEQQREQQKQQQQQRKGSGVSSIFGRKKQKNRNQYNQRGNNNRGRYDVRGPGGLNVPFGGTGALRTSATSPVLAQQQTQRRQQQQGQRIRLSDIGKQDQTGYSKSYGNNNGRLVDRQLQKQQQQVESDLRRQQARQQQELRRQELELKRQQAQQERELKRQEQQLKRQQDLEIKRQENELKRQETQKQAEIKRKEQELKRQERKVQQELKRKELELKKQQQQELKRKEVELKKQEREIKRKEQEIMRQEQQQRRQQERFSSSATGKYYNNERERENAFGAAVAGKNVNGAAFPARNNGGGFNSGDSSQSSFQQERQEPKRVRLSDIGKQRGYSRSDTYRPLSGPARRLGDQTSYRDRVNNEYLYDDYDSNYNNDREVWGGRFKSREGTTSSRSVNANANNYNGSGVNRPKRNPTLFEKVTKGIANSGTKTKLKADIAMLEMEIKSRKEKFGVEVYDIMAEIEYDYDRLIQENDGRPLDDSTIEQMENEKDMRIRRTFEQARSDIDTMQMKIDLKEEEIELMDVEDAEGDFDSDRRFGRNDARSSRLGGRGRGRDNYDYNQSGDDMYGRNDAQSFPSQRVRLSDLGKEGRPFSGARADVSTNLQPPNRSNDRYGNGAAYAPSSATTNRNDDGYDRFDSQRTRLSDRRSDFDDLYGRNTSRRNRLRDEDEWSRKVDFDDLYSGNDARSRYASRRTRISDLGKDDNAWDRRRDEFNRFGGEDRSDDIDASGRNRLRDMGERYGIDDGMNGYNRFVREDTRSDDMDASRRTRLSDMGKRYGIDNSRNDYNQYGINGAESGNDAMDMPRRTQLSDLGKWDDDWDRRRDNFDPYVGRTDAASSRARVSGFGYRDDLGRYKDGRNDHSSQRVRLSDLGKRDDELYVDTSAYDYGRRSLATPDRIDDSRRSTKPVVGPSPTTSKRINDRYGNTMGQDTK